MHTIHRFKVLVTDVTDAVIVDCFNSAPCTYMLSVKAWLLLADGLLCPLLQVMLLTPGRHLLLLLLLTPGHLLLLPVGHVEPGVRIHANILLCVIQLKLNLFGGGRVGG